MDIASKADETPDGCRVARLGDLLFVGNAGLQSSETEWIRLVQSIGRRDQRALHTLYMRTHRVVFTLIMRIISDPSSAEELTLDVFHDVWRRAANYDPAGGPVVGWIMNQARCRAIDRLRFERRKKRFNTRPDTDESVAVPASNGSDKAMEVSERRRLLEIALASLTQDERSTIETAFFSELTYSETARQLNLPIGTVKTRIRAGLNKLRRALSREVAVP